VGGGIALAQARLGAVEPAVDLDASAIVTTTVSEGTRRR
jgi:hypothetical protein